MKTRVGSLCFIFLVFCKSSFAAGIDPLIVKDPYPVYKYLTNFLAKAAKIRTSLPNSIDFVVIRNPDWNSGNDSRVGDIPPRRITFLEGSMTMQLGSEVTFSKIEGNGSYQQIHLSPVFQNLIERRRVNPLSDYSGFEVSIQQPYYDQKSSCCSISLEITPINFQNERGHLTLSIPVAESLTVHRVRIPFELKQNFNLIPLTQADLRTNEQFDESEKSNVLFQLNELLDQVSSAPHILQQMGAEEAALDRSLLQIGPEEWRPRSDLPRSMQASVTAFGITSNFGMSIKTGF